FEIAVIQGNRHATIKVPAQRFASMIWPTEALGSRAILDPGQGVREHARAAIQYLSPEVKERRVFTHLGWRKIEDRWVYLHAEGAIGKAGAEPGIEVAVPSALERYVLPDPPEGEMLHAALKASLQVLTVAPEVMTFPVYAALWRAVLGGADFGVHLTGLTGAGKTELAALMQRHHGAGLDARNLPASWTSTGNSLEGLAFAAKDSL